MTLVLSIVLAISSVAVQRQPDRPKEKPCTQWRGTVSGNDPSVSVTMSICNLDNNRVSGTLVWDSKTSGTNTRTVEGKRSGSSITMADISLTGNPKPGWMFCKVDRYSLSGSNDSLSGTYHSEACHDDATIKLERVR